MRRCHVASPLKARRDAQKASRRKAREMAMAGRLSNSRAEASLLRAEVGRHLSNAFDLAQRLADAEEQLRDLADVLPGRFIAVPAPHEVHNCIFQHESTIKMLPSLRPRPIVPYAPALTNEASFVEVLDAVRVAVDVNFDVMAKTMHAWIKTAVPGHGEAGAAYFISMEAIARTDPGVLARIITREVRPLFTQRLKELQLKLVRGSRGG